MVAPTTLLTALLFYFGWAHAYWFFQHFGIDITLLGLTGQDYMLRSVDALFVPAVILLTAGLLILWVHVTWTGRIFDGTQGAERLRRATSVLAILGLALFAVGLAGMLVPGLKRAYHLAYPLSMGTGTLLLLYASRLRRRAGGQAPEVGGPHTAALLEGTAAFLLVALSLFWATTNFAAEVGESRARQFERELESLPRATLYSKEPLNLDAPNVEENVCEESEAGYRLRYDGLRLMLRSGGQYFLLPESWSASDGVTMVIPESDTVRLEFSQSERKRVGSPASGCGGHP